MKMRRTWALWLAWTALAVGCAAQKPAPVVDRTTPGAVRTPTTVPEKGPVVIREAKDGVYTVQRGDTLRAIATAFGVDLRDFMRWNDLTDASVLRVGQQVRVKPPADTAVTVTPITPSGAAEARPLPAPTPLPPAGANAPAPVPAPAPPAVAPPESPSAAKPGTSPVAPAAGLQWQWPAAGKVIEGFDAPRNKGIDIAGTEGSPVVAAADGEVMHVGSALRGYGNLVIIRHPGDYVSAYGHNRKILVTQGQQVKRGQPIAELGRSDADRPKLHFEIRHQGTPLDPVKYLPPR